MASRILSLIVLTIHLTTLSFSIIISHATAARHLSARRRQPPLTEHPNKGRVDQMRRDLYSWECRWPKPTIVYIHDELQLPVDDEPLEIGWDPVAVVLHRCGRHSGCCTNYPVSSCQATGTSNATFPLRKKVPVGRLYVHKWVYETVTLVNHTSCACVSNGS